MWKLIDEGIRLSSAARELLWLGQGNLSLDRMERSSLVRVMKAEASDRLVAAARCLISIRPKPEPKPVNPPIPSVEEQAEAEAPPKRKPGRPKKLGLIPEPEPVPSA